MMKRFDLAESPDDAPRRAAMTLVAASLILIAAAATGHAQSWSVSKSAQVDQIVAHFRELNSADNADAALPTMSLSIGVNGRLAASKGYGASEGKPVNGHTLYEIGSITKQFTAAVALELIARGAVSAGTHAKVELKTPLSAVFGDARFWKAQPWLTVGRLLTMQSNLPNFTRLPPDGTDPWQPINSEVLFRDIAAQAPSTVSDDFDYSNTNYFLIAEMIDRCLLPGMAGPSSYHDLVRKWIFQAAGMTDTRFIDDQRAYFDPDASTLPARPVSAALNDQTAVWALPDYGRRQRPAFTHPDWLKGSADAVSSANDLFAWDKALMDAKVLPPKVRDMMLSDRARVSPMMYYGMGWFLEQKDGGEVYSHSGSVPGFTSFNEIVRQKDGQWYSVSILTSSDQLDGLSDLADSIAYIITE
jgi:D-alanyl-D-alanine carboxypeptidase